MKYIGVIISGVPVGPGGALLVLESAGRYKEGQTGGRGYIGLAALIFGNWQAGGPCDGCRSFRFRRCLAAAQLDSVRALILFVAIVLGFLARRASYVGQPLTGAGMIVAAVVFGVYFSITSKVPDQFVTITPYLTTLLVLVFAGAAVASARGRRSAVAQGPADLMARDRLGRAAPAAVEAAERAYAPYSHLQVGAAGARRRRPHHRGVQRRERVVRPDAVRRVRARVGTARGRGWAARRGGDSHRGWATRSCRAVAAVSCSGRPVACDLLGRRRRTVRPMRDVLPGAFDAERLAEGGSS